MADITDPQIVTFSNEKVRPAADRYAQLYWFSKIILIEYSASGIEAALAALNNSDVIIDGSETDGRTPITVGMIEGMMANLQLLVNDLEANSDVKLNGLTQIAVNETP